MISSSRKRRRTRRLSFVPQIWFEDRRYDMMSLSFCWILFDPSISLDSDRENTICLFNDDEDAIRYAGVSGDSLRDWIRIRFSQHRPCFPLVSASPVTPLYTSHCRYANPSRWILQMSLLSDVIGDNFDAHLIKSETCELFFIFVWSVLELTLLAPSSTTHCDESYKCLCFWMSLEIISIPIW